MMDSIQPHNNNQVSRPGRKRMRPSRRTNQRTMVVSILFLVAIVSTSPSVVRAFVPSGRSRSHTLAPACRQGPKPLCVSTLADMDTSSSDFYSGDERPEDILDLANMPLVAMPKKDGQRTTATKIPEEKEVLEWAERYTSVEALREHFGTNKNRLWGDLQASTARRLYKTLLPRALLDLAKMGKLHPQELAPLAYQARVAAKLYARERCTVPARLGATLFDGFRQWIKYGKFQSQGMTYDQLWEKYAEKILHQTESQHFLLQHHDDEEEEEECDPFHSDCEDLEEQVCLKILERACVSNEGVDAMTLRGKHWSDNTELDPHQRALLEQIRAQLEEDMYQLLLPEGHPEKEQNPQEKIRMPELHGRTRTRDRIRQGKLRLTKGLARQRRLWKLQKARKNLDRASSRCERPWNRRSKPWLSRPKVVVSDDSDALIP